MTNILAIVSLYPTNEERATRELAWYGERDVESIRVFIQERLIVGRLKSLEHSVLVFNASSILSSSTLLSSPLSPRLLRLLRRSTYYLRNMSEDSRSGYARPYPHQK